MIMRVPVAGVSACKSKGPDGVQMERMKNYVVACKCLKSNNRKVDVVEDFYSRPHKPVKFEVRCKKETQQVRVLKIPKQVPDYHSGHDDYRFC